MGGASLRINIMAELLPKLRDTAVDIDATASAAIALERAAPFDIQASDYWRHMEDERAWRYVSEIDSRWLELEPLVRSIENHVQSIFAAREQAYGGARLPPGFDATFYLLANPDVAAAKQDAADHYLRFGKVEGRQYAPTGA